MKIDEKQIASKEIVGIYNGKPVQMLQTKGGLNIIALLKNGNIELAGAGPHPGLAKFLAEKKFPEIVWNESLNKSEHAMCPTCRQLDDIYNCLCLYRWDLVNEK